MAQTNYTPIQLYYSSTAAAVPVNTNLLNGELAINITDGKLYYKDNSGTVQVIATKGAGTIGGSTTQIQYNNAGALAGSSAMVFNNSTNVITLTTLNLTNPLGTIYGGTGLTSYTTGDLLYSSASNTLAKLAIGTANYILTVNSGGTNVQWSAPSSISVSTATNLAGGVAGSVPYQSGASTTVFLGIGAADRVMTSSGTAPQWVTALTGLTGVSSSSITNTSLTSGRVVYSGTGGLQTNSANLTFDGTTLTTTGVSNTGTSTIVKLLTVGNTSFNGTTVFAAATPAKLYMGTGTVTDVTSAVSATNTTGAIASLAITPIAASNTGVTYTNASTLYIAGAPSAGTNITITNPYALYVAAGNVYLGGGTANGVAYLDTNKVLTTGSALVFDGTNLGLGVTPSAWALSGSSAFQVKNAGLAGYSNNAYLTANAYFTSAGGLNYISNGFSSYYSQASGVHAWFSAISGTAGTNAPMTQAMTLDASGNLGVGTSSPTAKLQISVASAAVNGTKGVRITNPAGTILMLECGSGGDSFVGTESGSDFNIRTGNSVVATFLNGGNVGIGNTSPSSYNSSADNLVIGTSGSNGMTIVSGSTSSGYIMFADGTTGQQAYEGQITYDHTNNFMAFNTSGTERARIDSSGNLGIGETSPSTFGKLVVKSGTINLVTDTATQRRLSFWSTSNGNSENAYIQVQNDGGTTNTGEILFATRNSGGTLAERARIDASGNLGIGTSSPSSFDSVADNLVVGTTSGNNGITIAAGTTGSSTINFADGTAGGAQYAGYIDYQHTGDYMRFGTNGGSERARIDSSGRLLVGTTSTLVNESSLGASSAGNTATFKTTGGSGTSPLLVWNSGTTGTRDLIQFSTGASFSSQGGITSNGSVLTYGGTSDYRLKEISGAVTGYKERLMALQPKQGVWKTDGSDFRGFLAHEFAQSYPASVIGEKDAVDADGNPKHQSMQASTAEVMADLVALIQEQQALITTLTARITALEGA